MAPLLLIRYIAHKCSHKDHMCTYIAHILPIYCPYTPNVYIRIIRMIPQINCQSYISWISIQYVQLVILQVIWTLDMLGSFSCLRALDIIDRCLADMSLLEVSTFTTELFLLSFLTAGRSFNVSRDGTYAYHSLASEVITFEGLLLLTRRYVKD